MRIGITMGDPNGVGPEIVLRAFAEGQLPAGRSVVFGDLSVLSECAKALNIGVSLRRVERTDALPGDGLAVLDAGLLQPRDLRIGCVDEAAGRAALAYVETATRAALARDIGAIVTLPVNKEAIRLSTPDFTGHTGYIAQMCGITQSTMMLASPTLLAAHVTTHASLREAIESLSAERIGIVIGQTDRAAAKLRRNRRIAVFGLNPHAGEGGAFGREEIEIIRPAIEAARRGGMDVAGPLPPDTVFPKALRGEFGAVVCMYHDQGHITMKTLDFEGTVNVTLGLPIVRTSVDHGTAFDIAWKGIASTRSFLCACRMAEDLSAPGNDTGASPLPVARASRP